VHSANEAKTLSWQRLDEALFFPGIADRASGSIEAGGQRHIGHDASIPDGVHEIVFADDALPVPDQVIEQIENLRCGRNDVGTAMQLAAVGVESVILEEITQTADPPGDLRSSGR
jgi:hypothetical protein